MALTVVRDVALGVLLALPCSVVCRGDDYPNRPIHLIVPFLPGGVADVIARPVAERMARSLGEPVVVENRGGVTGTLGARTLPTRRRTPIRSCSPPPTKSP